MKRPVLPPAFAVIVILLLAVLVSCAGDNLVGRQELPEWQWKSTIRITNYPKLKRTIWETGRPPYGPYDKIRLIRLTKDADGKNTRDIGFKNPGKVIFMIPGTWGASSPSTTYAYNENRTLSIYLANHGYDVYSLDFRTSFLPDMATDQFATYEIDISSTGEWTYALFREDIKFCVEAVKTISGAKKVFMTGASRGGRQMFIYASEYPEDLKGLISLDGGGKISPPNKYIQLSEKEYEAAVADFKANGVLLNQLIDYECIQWAGSHPYSVNAPGYGNLADYFERLHSLCGDAPEMKDIIARGFSIDTVADVVAYGLYYLTDPDGRYTNYYGGYIDRRDLIRSVANLTRYWPTIQNLEDRQLHAWDNCPYLDYDDRLADLPLIAFISEFDCPEGSCLDNPDNMTLSDDVTFIFLKDWGHLDIYFGNRQAESISRPLLVWMNDRL